MRGVVYIERENTDGDRRTVRTLDVEGFSVTLGDPMEVIRRVAHEALVDPENHAYTIRAIHDDGWNSRVVYRESYGDRAWINGTAARDELQRRADEIYKGDRAQDINENRCPICGGLNSGDVTHTRCL